ncbi:MAG: glycerol kinase GlpK, partial [Lacticaseibacillus paracasei]|nr:glycerol kinase GlpK [Lacticaseibacillus paracasei]
MPEGYVGALDAGTTSTRFILFDTKGKIVAIHQTEFTQIYSQPGWVEHDPDELVETALECMSVVRKKLKVLGIHPIEVKAIGVTNQRETTCVWDKETGEPLSNAIVWSDARTTDTVAKLKAKPGADKIQGLCGLPISTYFAGVKLRWLLDNNKDVKAAYDKGNLCFGTVDSWLLWNLTGGLNGGRHITDATNASRSMFMNIRTLKYDPELLKFFGVEKAILPEIVSSSEVYARLGSGPFSGVPLSGCLGDQSAALVGQLGFRPGEAKNTYGTGCFLLYNTGEEPIISKNGLLTTIGFKFGKEGKPFYALEGSISVAGSAIKWLRDNIGLIASSEEIGELAAKVDDNAGVVFVTALSGLFAPYWRDDARGTILGLTQFTKKEHICRATLEAVCFQSKAILDAMEKDSGTPFKTLKVDGGITNSDVAMQIQADLLGISVERPEMRETTALGAAIAAGFAVGVWKSFDELLEINKENKSIFEPQYTEERRE